MKKSRPSKIVIWMFTGIVMLIGAYVLGTFLLQENSSPIQDSGLETEQLP